ncbi:hypothetical protein NBRC116492_10750 [Aurantivibrio infirmus]
MTSYNVSVQDRRTTLRRKGDRLHSELSENYHSVKELGIEFFVGLFLFSAIAGVAFFIGYIVKLLEGNGTHTLITLTLGYVELFMFFLDVTLLVVYLLSKGLKFVKSVWPRD